MYHWSRDLACSPCCVESLLLLPTNPGSVDQTDYAAQFQLCRAAAENFYLCRSAGRESGSFEARLAFLTRVSQRHFFDSGVGSGLVKTPTCWNIVVFFSLKILASFNLWFYLCSTLSQLPIKNCPVLKSPKGKTTWVGQMYACVHTLFPAR